MASNIVNRDPYLRTTREFPEELHQLSIECNRAYRDTASCMNDRTIGIYPTGNPAVSGDQYFISGGNTKQQSLRQVFPFSAIAAGTNLSLPYKIAGGFTQFVRIYGTCKTALPDNRPIPYASVAANSNIDLRVDPSNIIISNGAAAPAITSGLIVLEWLSAV